MTPTPRAHVERTQVDVTFDKREGLIEIRGRGGDKRRIPLKKCDFGRMEPVRSLGKFCWENVQERENFRCKWQTSVIISLIISSYATPFTITIIICIL
jgi:hypothetical protein